MRKTVLMTLFTLALISCKDESFKKNEVTPALQNCKTSIADYLKIPETDITNRTLWLKKNGKDVDSVILFKITFLEHRLPKGSYNRAINDYGSQELLKLNWKTIKDSIKDHYYDKYVSFEETQNNGLKLVLVDDFTEKTTCYSVPLFLSIADKLKLSDNDTTTIFEFGKANKQNYLTQNPYVIFKIVNSSGSDEFEMNYSTKPELIEVQNPL